MNRETEDVVAELLAIGEEEMYQAPATTHKTINNAADLIQSLSDRIDVLEELLGRALPFVGENEALAHIIRASLRTTHREVNDVTTSG